MNYLDQNGLNQLAGFVKERLKKVATMPSTPSDGTIVLYTGETTEDFVLGHIYKYDTDAWVDLTPAGGSAELQAALTTSLTVGGITSGTEYAQGTSLETIIRDLLNPTQNPTLTNPSATLSASPTGLLIETGGTKTVTITADFNRGSISPAYGTSGYRSGPAVDYSLNSGTAQSENTWSDIVVDSEHASYSAVVNYSAGEQPKNSKGENYDSPLAAGSVTSNTMTYEFVNALWANTDNIATVAKLSLVSKSTKKKEFTFPASTVAQPEIFDVPISWSLTTLKVYDDFNKEWIDASSEFTITDTTHDDAAGVSTAYKRYTCNLPYPMDSRRIQIEWS